MKKLSQIIFIFILLFALFCTNRSARAASTLRIGFITDWEYQIYNSDDKLSLKASSYLKYAVDQLNDKNLHVAIGGGDYIEGSDTTEANAIKYLKDMNKTFKKIEASRRYYLIGNHDLRALDTGQCKSALGIDYLHKAFVKRGFKVILLDTNFDEDGGHRGKDHYAEGYVSDGELDWLEDEIESSEEPVIIFSHHSPARPNDRRDIKNSSDVTEVIEKSGKVVAVVSGHYPRYFHEEENGVHYFVVSNLVNKKDKKSYAYIKLQKRGSRVYFKLQQKGKTKRSVSFNKIINI